MSKKSGGKLLQLINYRLKVTLNDSRYMIGQMLAYDKHMNLVMADCEEFRLVKKKTKKGDADEDDDPTIEMKRTLGLIILRGETIVSISVEGPPPAAPDDKSSLAAGAGRAGPAGRGMGINLGAPGIRGQAQINPQAGFRPPGMPGMPGAPPGFAPPPGMMPPPGFPMMPPAGFAPPPGHSGFVPPR